jgi:hypothetical protein
MKCMPTTLSARLVTAAETRDRDRRRVRGEDRPRLGDPVQLREQLALDVEFLDHRLHDEIRRGHVREVPRELDALQRGRAVGGRELALLRELAQAAVDLGAGALEGGAVHVAEHDGVTGLREHLGDAVAHRARADDGDLEGHLAQTLSTARATPLPPPRQRAAIPLRAPRSFIA